MIHLTVEQVQAEVYKQYDPERHDFVWNSDGSCDIFPLRWWDDASYAQYQGDQSASYEPAVDENGKTL